MEAQAVGQAERERHSEYVLLEIGGGYLVGWVSQLNWDNAVSGNADTLLLSDPAIRIVSQVVTETGMQTSFCHILVELGIPELRVRWAHVAAWSLLAHDGDVAQVHRHLVEQRESGLVLPPTVRRRREGQA